MLWSHRPSSGQDSRSRYHFSLRGFFAKEGLAFREATEKLHAEEERIGEQIARESPFHGRPHPSLRKVKGAFN